MLMKNKANPGSSLLGSGDIVCSKFAAAAARAARLARLLRRAAK
jgi:hypothetical protein